MYKNLEIGQRIAIERKRLGRTQADFATLGCVSNGTQISYESGKTSPTADYLLQIASHGADMNFILTGTRALVAADGRAVYESNRKDGFQTAGQLLAAEIAVMELAEDDAEAILHIARKLADT